MLDFLSTLNFVAFHFIFGPTFCLCIRFGPQTKGWLLTRSSANYFGVLVFSLTIVWCFLINSSIWPRLTCRTLGAAFMLHVMRGLGCLSGSIWWSLCFRICFLRFFIYLFRRKQYWIQIKHRPVFALFSLASTILLPLHILQAICSSIVCFALQANRLVLLVQSTRLLCFPILSLIFFQVVMVSDGTIKFEAFVKFVK